MRFPKNQKIEKIKKQIEKTTKNEKRNEKIYITKKHENLMLKWTPKPSKNH